MAEDIFEKVRTEYISEKQRLEEKHLRKLGTPDIVPSHRREKQKERRKKRRQRQNQTCAFNAFVSSAKVLDSSANSVSSTECVHLQCDIVFRGE